MSELDEIVKEFLIESNDGLDKLDQDLIQLEKDPDSPELIARIFRTIHTIKGTSGVLGFPKLTALAHVGESLLSRMRDGKIRLQPAITTALLALVDAIRQMLTAIADTGSEGDQDFTCIENSLSSLIGGAIKPTPKVVSNGLGMKREDALTGPDGSGHPLTPSDSNDVAVVTATESDHGRPSEGTTETSVDKDTKAEGEPRSSDLSNTTIRVDVGLLDRLMNLVGELVLARNQVLQFTATDHRNTFLSTAQRLNLITTELQEGVMKTRMQPIGNIWNKFPRVIRDLALSCDKKVTLEMEGAETELDKTIIEAIKDPLTHMVRNAVDHGIEKPETRRAAGKPETGRLSLRAFHEGGQVNIEISDDGAGIDVERVKQKAIANNVISAQQAARMSERELLGLVFLPGLSTAKQVTNISGRGVGMDVVKTNIEKIGGTIDLQSTPAVGTTIKVKIPLTLAIIPALVVTTGGERFAIPQVSLLELVRLEGEQATKSVEMVHGVPVYRLRGRLLPLVYLSHELHLTSRASDEVTNIVVLQADDRQFGLVVDDINDTEEIVVKPLSKHLKGVSCFAGATIMGDGHVALILDVLGTAQMSNVISEVRDRAMAELEERRERSATTKDSWLLFRVGNRGRMAVPLSLVSRLEEFSASVVEQSGDLEVIQYRNHIMPLIPLANKLGLETIRNADDPLQVFVHARNGRNVGFVVDQIIDIVEDHVVPQTPYTSSVLLGSAVIQGRVTDLVNLPSILDNAMLNEVAHA